MPSLSFSWPESCKHHNEMPRILCLLSQRIFAYSRNSRRKCLHWKENTYSKINGRFNTAVLFFVVFNICSHSKYINCALINLYRMPTCPLDLDHCKQMGLKGIMCTVLLHRFKAISKDFADTDQMNDDARHIGGTYFIIRHCNKNIIGQIESIIQACL